VLKKAAETAVLLLGPGAVILLLKEGGDDGVVVVVGVVVDVIEEDAVAEGNALGAGDKDGRVVVGVVVGVVVSGWDVIEEDAAAEGNALGAGDKDGRMVLVGPSDGGSAACWRRERNEDGPDNEDEGRGRQSSVVKRPQISKEEVRRVIIILLVGCVGKIEVFRHQRGRRIEPVQYKK
jgi:hypothetical protein